MSEQAKPCEATCPKCGSADVRVRWVPKRGRVENEEYGKCRNRYAFGQCNYYEARREHMDNKCRCCFYRWQSLPIAKRRKAAATPDKEPTDD